MKRQFSFSLFFFSLSLALSFYLSLIPLVPYLSCFIPVYFSLSSFAYVIGIVVLFFVFHLFFFVFVFISCYHRVWLPYYFRLCFAFFRVFPSFLPSCFDLVYASSFVPVSSIFFLFFLSSFLFLSFRPLPSLPSLLHSVLLPTSLPSLIPFLFIQ